ncbi:hypothetical protein PV326_001104, partial [Microctonus aethiopoides]
MTLGKINLKINNIPNEFHVIPEEFPLKYAGIIGTEFMHKHNAIIDYERKSLIENNLREGYIEQINLPKGIYAGKSIVSNNNGRAYIFAINTREDDVTVEVPVVPLFPFETSDDENKNEPKNAPLSTINARDRVEKVIIIKKLIKRKRGRSRKKRTHKPHTNLPNIVLTFDSTDSNTDKYNLIKKKPRIKSDSENTDNDNYDTSDSETSVYSVKMGINP